MNDGLMVSLTDMWKACGSERRNRSVEWLRNGTTLKLIETIENKFKGGNYHLKILKVIKGRYGGTYANKTLAIAYAEYLSSSLGY